MKKLLIALLFIVVGRAYADDWRTSQSRVWKSSQLQCGNYSNVLISSTPIIFNMVIGSPTTNQGGTSQFVLQQSTAFPFLANITSTMAFITTDQANSGLGQAWGVRTTTNTIGHVFSYFNKAGGACPIFYLWDYWQNPPEPNSGLYFPKD